MTTADTAVTSFWSKPFDVYYGAGLILVGIVAYAAAGAASWTALIPALLGVAVFGAILGGRRGLFSEPAARWITVAIALVAIVATAGALPGLGYALGGHTYGYAGVSTVAQSVTALLSFGYLLLIARIWFSSRFGW